MQIKNNLNSYILIIFYPNPLPAPPVGDLVNKNPLKRSHFYAYLLKISLIISLAYYH